jgi:hypothetical protein
VINTIVYSWKRSLPGREALSAQYFAEFTAYLAGLRSEGRIASFEPVLLEPNGRMSGFFLIYGSGKQLAQVLDSPAWSEHITRSLMHLDEPVLACGSSGEAVGERLRAWAAHIPA